MNTRSFIFFTRILARAQISSLTSEGFFIEVLSVTILETTKTCFWFGNRSCKFYRSQFWRLQKQALQSHLHLVGFIGHNFGDYKNRGKADCSSTSVLSVTILETTKTASQSKQSRTTFYRSQFWRLQKLQAQFTALMTGFIGHNFGDYKNLKWYQLITP